MYTIHKLQFFLKNTFRITKSYTFGGSPLKKDHAYFETLLSLNKPACIYPVDNGQQALKYLSKMLHPTLILWSMDSKQTKHLKMIEHIKQNLTLKDIPIIALFEAPDLSLILHCYDMGIKAYVVKPASQPEFINLLQIIESYSQKNTVYQAD